MTLGRAFQEECDWKVGVLTGLRIVFSSTADVLYRRPPPTVSDSVLGVEKTRLRSVGIRTVFLHAGSESRSYTVCLIS